MGILDRINGALKKGVSGALAPAPDPRVTQVSAHQKQLALLSQVAKAISDVTATKAHLQAIVVGARAKPPAMLVQAREELRTGNEVKARLTLQRRQAVLLELQALERQLADVEKEEANLTTIEMRLEGQVQAFAARQEVIKARFSAAEAQVQLNEAVTGVSRGFADLTEALRHAEDTTERMEARATAINKLVLDGDLSTDILGDASSMALPPPPALTDEEVERQIAALQSEQS